MNPKETSFFKALGVRIAYARKAHQLTQGQLAERLDVGQQTLAHYEAGKVRVPMSLLPKLSQTLGLSADELVGQNIIGPNVRRATSKLQQQIEAVSQLPKARQRFVFEMLDTVLARQRL